MTPYEQLKEEERAGKIRLSIFYQNGKLQVMHEEPDDMVWEEKLRLFDLFLASIDEIEAEHSLEKKDVKGNLFAAITSYVNGSTKWNQATKPESSAHQVAERQRTYQVK
jgi:hypothetical protein